ncbi:hypothetical protein QPL79_06370 [Ignisphaera sp. 4213-co]|uniref:Uncharacterized protein n=1 Tax=Ignisphaera cupida TaxID=3050454 RepID=A0ABD4Z8D6_9CREN|nr:hypothetical protein [Ignisphaera sp. 4213-co]MDK6028984.1 hypothetical protein [Ignisphaera sp. 4213-co]
MKLSYRLKDVIAYLTTVLSPVITLIKIDFIKSNVAFILNFLYSDPMLKALTYLLLISIINSFLILGLGIVALIKKLNKPFSRL